MPVLDYDYDYYEYRNGKKVNKSFNRKSVTFESNSSFSTVKNRQSNAQSTRQLSRQVTRQSVTQLARKQTRQLTKEPVRETARQSTRQSTREQVRNAMAYNEPRKRTSKGRKDELEIPTMVSAKKQVTPKRQVTSRKQTMQKPVEMKLKKPQQSASQKKKAKEKLITRIKNILYLCCGFVVAFFICYRYSLINEKFNELEKTKKELETAQTVNEQIQADIDSQTDLSYIENYARYQLGMQKPSNSQIVYVNMEKQDRILTPVVVEEDTDKSWFEQLYEEISKFFK